MSILDTQNQAELERAKLEAEQQAAYEKLTDAEKKAWDKRVADDAKAEKEKAEKEIAAIAEKRRAVGEAAKAAALAEYDEKQALVESFGKKSDKTKAVADLKQVKKTAPSKAEVMQVTPPTMTAHDKIVGFLETHPYVNDIYIDAQGEYQLAPTEGYKKFVREDFVKA